MRAAAYVRTSTDQQKYSLENQIAAIEAFCAAARMELVQIFADVGKSGVTLAGRPGMRSLFDTIESGAAEFEAVVVFDVSRWGRFQDVDEGAYYEHHLRLAGAPVLYCAEVFDDDGSPAATILKAMRRAMAAEYSRDLSRRIRNGSRRAAARGFHLCGRPPFGYRRAIVDSTNTVVCVADQGQRKLLSSHHTTLVPGPDAEVAAVRRVFHLFGNRHLTMTSIAKQMAAEPWPRPWSRGWSDDLVRKMLRNEKYVGAAVYGRTTGPLHTRRTRKPTGDWVIVSNAHEPLIPRSLFERVQKRLAHRRRFSRAEVIKGLRELVRIHGQITLEAIASSSSLPSVAAIHDQFGSLSAAYTAAGVPPPPRNGKRRSPEC